MRKTVFVAIAAPIIATLIACSAASNGVTSTGDDASATPAASGSASASPAGPTTVKAGAKITVTEEVFGDKTVVEYTLTNVKFNVKSGNQFITPSKGQFITADVTAVVKEGKASVNSSMFKLVGPDGTSYDTTSMLDRSDISGSDITAGQKVAGTIVFDVAKDVKAGKGKIAVKS